MKVIHVIAGLGDGGAEAVLAQLCLADRDNQHIVASLMDAGKYGAQLEKAGIHVHCLNMPPGLPTATGLWRLFRLMRNERPDIVQTWMYHADLIGGGVARLSGSAKVCWGIHTSSIDREKLKPSTFMVAQQCAWLSTLIPTLIISCSREGAKHHIALGYAQDRLRVIPNGYDIDQFHPDPSARARLRREWGVADDQPLIGMVARYDPLKDHANLFAAMAELRGAKLEIVWALVGHGLNAQNEELVASLRGRELTDRVLLLGPRKDIPDVMNAFDVHVLSSRLEGFPNVLAEAMACGTPCVATRVGDAELIVGESGWLVAPRDATALAFAIEAALHAREDVCGWAARRTAARARISEHFDLIRMCRNYRTAWADAVSAEHP